MQAKRPTLARRAIAILVLAIAGWVVLKFVISLVAGLATAIMLVVAVLAILWAIRTL